MIKTDIRKIYSDLSSFENQTVTRGGWVRSARDLKNFGFIDLNDGTSFKGAQIVINSNMDNYAIVSKLNAGSSILCTGKIVLTPNAKQPFEMQCDSVEVVCQTDETYPLQKKGHSYEFLREQAYLRPRTNVFNAVFRVRSEASFALHQFFNNEGFVYLQAPIFTSSDCEGAGELFKVSTQDI